MSALLLAFLGWIVGAALPTSSPASKFDAAQFSRLTQEDQFECIVELLQWRERLLQNFSYDLVETLSSVQSDGSLRKFQRTEFSLHSLGTKSRIDARTEYKDGQVLNFSSAWDGNTRKSITRRPQFANPFGTIADSEIPMVREKCYNDVIGFRALDASTPKSKSTWLRDQVQVRKYPVSVNSEESLVRVRIEMGPKRTHELWLDPARDFLTVREEYVSRHPDGDATTRFRKVLDSRRIDGSWIPTKVVEDRTTKSKLGTTRYEYAVGRFEWGKVTPNDVAVQFEPRTQVYDQVSQVAFEVLPNGGQKLTPLFNPETGLTTVGKQTPQEIFASAKNPFPNSHPRRAVWVAAGTGVLLCASAIVWFVRRRRALA